MPAQPGARPVTARLFPDWEDFANEYWDRRPCLWPEMDATGYADLLTIDDIDALLTESGVRFPAVKVVSGGRKIAPGEYTRAGTIGSVRVDDLIDGEAVRAFFAAGATIVLASMHRYWPPLERFCRALEQAFSHPVQVNTYLTPADARGLDLHWDTHDVFVMQCFGEKHWEVHAQGFAHPLRHQHRAGPLTAPGDPLIAETLRPGDCLYIPRGFVHGAETKAAASAHLTVGIRTYSWVSVFRQLLDRIEDEPELRRSLPVGFADDRPGIAAVADEKLAVLADIVASADVDELVHALTDRRIGQLGATPVGQVASIARLGRVDDDSRLRRRSSERWDLAIRDDRVRLSSETAVLDLPSRTMPAIEHMADADAFEVGELARWLDRPGREVLVTRFLREGILEVDLGSGAVSDGAGSTGPGARQRVPL